MTTDLLQSFEGGIATLALNRPLSGRFKARNALTRDRVQVLAEAPEVLDAEAVHRVRTFETEDHKGAALALVEKRPPRFAGR